MGNKTVRSAGNNNDPPAIVAPTGLVFQITETKFYVAVVTLSTENDKKLLEHLNAVFKWAVMWNKYRWEMAIQNNNTT